MGTPTLTPQPQSLVDFLLELPAAFGTQLFAGLLLAGTIGMLAHYALKWARGEIRINLFCYLWIHRRSTLLSFFTYVGAALTAIQTNAFFGEGGLFVGWKMVFWLGLSNGFTIDAIVNRTRRAEWTASERFARHLERKVGAS